MAIGPSEQSLIAATVRRVEPLCPPERTLIATGVHLLDSTRTCLPWLPAASFMGEPVAKNTAPCIAWATWEAHKRDPEALVMVLPSDHHIGDEPEFRKVLERAVEAARSGAITTIGIEPTRPETGFGYIESGDALSPGVRRVVRFVEKPDRARAEEYLATGRYFWNSGMFIFRADVMLAEVRRHLPVVAEGLERIDLASPADAARETARAFEAFPSISIDYAIMEKAENLAVLPARFGWSDLGSWQSAWELSPKDGHGNAAPETAVLADANGNLVRDLSTRETRRLIALVGVSDLCVIETDDALLVIPREQAQDVRKVVEALKTRGRADLL